MITYSTHRRIQQGVTTVGETVSIANLEAKVEMAEVRVTYRTRVSSK